MSLRAQRGKLPEGKPYKSDDTMCPLTNLILIEKTKLYAIIYVQRPQTYIVHTVCNFTIGSQY